MLQLYFGSIFYLVGVTKRSCFVLKYRFCHNKHGWRCPEVSLKIFSGFTLTNIETVSNCSHWLGSLLTFCHSATIPSASRYEQTCNVKMTHTSRHVNMVTKPMTRTNVNIAVVRRNINCQHFILASGLAKNPCPRPCFNPSAKPMEIMTNMSVVTA